MGVALRENAITLLARKTGLTLNITTKQSIFIVPTGKSMIVTHCLVRNVSAAAVTADAGFGGDAGATDFRAAVQFDNLAVAGDGVMVTPDDGGASSPVPGKMKTYAAAVDFGMKVGTVIAATVDVDLYGYLF